MRIIYSVLGIIVIVTGVILWRCWMRQRYLKKLRQTDSSPVFLKKLAYIERREQRKLLATLQFIVLVLTVGLLLSSGALYVAQQQKERFAEKLAQQEDTLATVRTMTTEKGTVETNVGD